MLAGHQGPVQGRAGLRRHHYADRGGGRTAQVREPGRPLLLGRMQLVVLAPGVLRFCCARQGRLWASCSFPTPAHPPATESTLSLGSSRYAWQRNSTTTFTRTPPDRPPCAPEQGLAAACDVDRHRRLGLFHRVGGLEKAIRACTPAAARSCRRQVRAALQLPARRGGCGAAPPGAAPARFVMDAAHLFPSTDAALLLNLASLSLARARFFYRLRGRFSGWVARRGIPAVRRFKRSSPSTFDHHQRMKRQSNNSCNTERPIY